MLIYDRLQRAQCLLPRRIHYHCLAHNGDQYTGGNETCADWSAPQWASHRQKADWIMETRWIESKQTGGGVMNLHFIEFTSVKYTIYLVAELVWPLRQKPFESCGATLWQEVEEMARGVLMRWKSEISRIYPPPPSFDSVVLPQFNRCFKSNCCCFPTRSRRLVVTTTAKSRWNGDPHLVAASFSSFITHTHTNPKTCLHLITPPHPTVRLFSFLSFYPPPPTPIPLLSFSPGFLQIPLTRFLAFHARLSFSGIVSLV